MGVPQDDVVFNRQVPVDLSFLEGDAVLPVLDCDTPWSAAGFMTKGRSADATWDLFMKIWVTTYVGNPREIHVDEGSRLQSPQWRAKVEVAGTKQRYSGVESHNSLGVGECYHAPLRHNFRRVRAVHPSIPMSQTLALSIWAMNQTAGPMGISPVLLVFGISPRMPVNPFGLPTHRERRKSSVGARADMVIHVVRARPSTALRRNVPKAAVKEIFPGMRVLVYREKPIDAWRGQHTVQIHDGRQVWVYINDRLKLLSMDKVKEFLGPLRASEEEAAAVAAEALSYDDLGNANDAVIAGDERLCDLGLHFGSVEEKEYRETGAEAETPARIFKTDSLWRFGGLGK